MGWLSWHRTSNMLPGLLDRLEAAEAEGVNHHVVPGSCMTCMVNESNLIAAEAENERLARHYEELRQATDGGSESMTHADACHVVEALEQQLAEVKAENTRLLDDIFALQTELSAMGRENARLRAWMESQRRGVIGFAGEWLPSGPTLWEEYVAPNAAPVVTVLPRTITAGADSLVTERDFTSEPTVVEGRE